MGKGIALGGVAGPYEAVVVAAALVVRWCLSEASLCIANAFLEHLCILVEFRILEEAYLGKDEL